MTAAVKLPCGHADISPSSVCGVCVKYASDEGFAAAVRRHQRELVTPSPPAPCKFLREPVSAFRRRCLIGHANPDGLGGVKPCCDCGPGKCGDYRAAPDGI